MSNHSIQKYFDFEGPLKGPKRVRKHKISRIMDVCVCVCVFCQPFVHFLDRCLHYIWFAFGDGGRGGDGFVAWEKDSKFMQLFIKALITHVVIILDEFFYQMKTFMFYNVQTTNSTMIDKK